MGPSRGIVSYIVAEGEGAYRADLEFHGVEGAHSKVGRAAGFLIARVLLGVGVPPSLGGCCEGVGGSGREGLAVEECLHRLLPYRLAVRTARIFENGETPDAKISSHVVLTAIRVAGVFAQPLVVR